MIAIILMFNRRKESSLEENLFHLSPIAMRLSRYAGATPGTGCCGDSIAGDIHRTGSCPLFELKFVSLRTNLPRKEVIQPHLPVRLPCYDFTPLTLHTFGASPLDGWAGDFGCRRLGWCDGRCVQGPGTHSPRHADPRLLATPTSWGRVAAPNPNWGRLSGIRSPSRGGIPLYRPL